ncbi:MAG: hypothetical protein KGJ23_09805 [Euryarchaeota archaeon]|nr:hypothetical protein [Euryarchaeota archaeon]MDE1836897.1 hypothetical protein [Euryarchaeota archaeon]MDE1881710.1 hypothetical protein [Euryarchaeota archaeon]MDE2045300.1 hypothetical protein [Thermoplasmata archaeon]
MAFPVILITMSVGSGPLLVVGGLLWFLPFGLGILFGAWGPILGVGRTVLASGLVFAMVAVFFGAGLLTILALGLVQMLVSSLAIPDIELASFRSHFHATGLPRANPDSVDPPSNSEVPSG